MFIVRSARLNFELCLLYCSTRWSVPAARCPSLRSVFQFETNLTRSGPVLRPRSGGTIVAAAPFADKNGSMITKAQDSSSIGVLHLEVGAAILEEGGGSVSQPNIVRDLEPIPGHGRAVSQDYRIGRGVALVQDHPRALVLRIRLPRDGELLDVDAQRPTEEECEGRPRLTHRASLTTMVCESMTAPSAKSDLSAIASSELCTSTFSTSTEFCICATGTSTQPWVMPMHIDWTKGVGSGRGQEQSVGQPIGWGG